MDLYDILSLLNNDTIKNLIYMLKHSPCSNSKYVYDLLCQNEDLYEILQSRTDKIGKSILKSRTITSLNLLGSYELYRKEFNKRLRNMLIYPILLTVFTNILLLILRGMLPVRNYTFLLQFVLIPIVYLGIFYLKNQYLKFIRIFFMKLLIHNQITLNDIIILLSDLNINVDIRKTQKIICLSDQICGIPCHSQEEVDVIFQTKLADLNISSNNIILLINNLCFVVIAGIVALSFLQVSRNLMENLVL